MFITHNVHHALPIGDRFVILNRGRVAWWVAHPAFLRGRLWLDAMGRHHLAATGSVNAARLGHVKGGLRGLTLPAASGAGYSTRRRFPYAATRFTFAAWYNATGRSTYQQLIGEEEGSGAGAGLRILGNDLYIIFKTDTYHNSIYAAGAVTTGTYHLAATWDGTTARLYVNGSQVNSWGANGSLVAMSAGHLQVGWNTRYGDPLGGTVTDVCYYDRCLSAGEMALLARSAPAGWPGLFVEDEGVLLADAPPPDPVLPRPFSAHLRPAKEPVPEYVW